MSVNLGIPDAQLVTVKQGLEHVFALESDLYKATLECHWNVTGEHFSSLHALFEEQYMWLASTMDSLAERLRMLGFTASYPSTSQESMDVRCSSMHMLRFLLEKHEAAARSIRDVIKSLEGSDDFVSEDFFVSLLAEHEKQSWMLRSHVTN